MILPTCLLARFSSAVSSGSSGVTTSGSFAFDAVFLGFGFDLDADCSFGVFGVDVDFGVLVSFRTVFGFFAESV